MRRTFIVKRSATLFNAHSGDPRREEASHNIAGAAVKRSYVRWEPARLSAHPATEEESQTMTNRVLARSQWHFYFDRVSKALAGKSAQIEVTGLQIGDQIVSKGTRLLGITYDPKDDLLEITVEGLDHLIRSPRGISVEEGPQGLKSMEVVDSEDRRQIVLLAEPLRLPAPEH